MNHRAFLCDQGWWRTGNRRLLIGAACSYGLLKNLLPNGLTSDGGLFREQAYTTGQVGSQQKNFFCGRQKLLFCLGLQCFSDLLASRGDSTRMTA
jgi:hypothetical protein